MESCLSSTAGPRWQAWASKCAPCGFCGALLPPGATYCTSCEAEVGGAARRLDPHGSRGSSVETCRLHAAVSDLADACDSGTVTDAQRGARAARIAGQSLEILDALGEATSVPGLVTREIAEAMVCAFDAFMDAASALRATPPNPASARDRAYVGARFLCHAYAHMARRLDSEKEAAA